MSEQNAKNDGLPSNPFDTKVFNRPMGPEVNKLIHTALESPLDKATNSNLDSYERYLGPEPKKDELEITLSEDSVKRVVTINLQPFSTPIPPNDVLRESPDKQGAHITEIYDTRSMNLPDGIQVTQIFWYDKKIGYPPFRFDSTTISIPLVTVPQVEGEPMTIQISFENDTDEVEPNTVLYETDYFNKSWHKTYAYRNRDGEIIRPDYEPNGPGNPDISVSHKQFQVGFILISGGEEQHTIDSILTKAAMGEPDKSLAQLVATAFFEKTSQI